MKRLMFALMLLGCARPVRAQDMDAMLKWTETKVVHYHAVGEFSRTLIILPRAEAAVTDRVEIDFDWNQEENQLVGNPAIKNSPSKVGAIAPMAGCPAPKVNGAFEFITILSLKDQPDETMRMAAAGLVMEGRRDHPAAEVPLLPSRAADACGATWEKLAARSEATSETLAVPLAMLLAMGKMGGENVAPDGKSFVYKFDEGTDNAGWTWTYTPTVAK
jgi:hypothetical protein